jgi:hypothetical protein
VYHIFASLGVFTQVSILISVDLQEVSFRECVTFTTSEVAVGT